MDQRMASPGWGSKTGAACTCKPIALVGKQCTPGLRLHVRNRVKGVRNHVLSSVDGRCRHALLVPHERYGAACENGLCADFLPGRNTGGNRISCQFRSEKTHAGWIGHECPTWPQAHYCARGKTEACIGAPTQGKSEHWLIGEPSKSKSKSKEKDKKSGQECQQRSRPKLQGFEVFV